MQRKVNKKDIAIIGMSCHFPKSKNAMTFWENLKEGVDLVDTYTDKELEVYGVSKEMITNPNFQKIGSSIEDSENFDFSFFGYTQDEAKVMDPQIRLMHTQVWAALEDANIDANAFKGKTGLYLSAGNSYNWITNVRINPNENIDPFLTLKLSDGQFISSLISYKLNLTGPSLKIDTACSSSLTAIHLAYRNLLLRECDLAVAGGVSINTVDTKGYYYQEGMIFSKDGRCKPFDKDSSGIIGGEGLGVVVLKRLEEAIQDKDHIYGVIKSSAVNNDGNNKVGYTAPSVNGQSKCISTAYKFGGIDPKTVGFIEAHGTGTQLGDPIEISSLNKVFKKNLGHKCAIGSVKSNMGHLDTAAGVAGFIKASLALKHKIIPPTLHFKENNPRIDFKSGPFYVNAKAEKWNRNTKEPLRAGVSSLGIGGTNVHIVLEEAPDLVSGNFSRKYQLFLFSAKSQNSLNAYIEKMGGYIKENKDISLRDVAYTLKVGRTPFKERDFMICKDSKDAIDQLGLIGRNNSQRITPAKREVVFMFSGQGSQFIEMGKTLYDEELFFKNIMDEGFSRLKHITSKDYKEIIGYDIENTFDPEAINNTSHAQPLLFLLEYALSKLLMHWGIVPVNMIGHSLGEYTAACIAGVMSFEDALKIIVKRGELMSAIDEGDMIAVGTSIDVIRTLITPSLSVAAVNTKDSCTISGRSGDVADFIKILALKEIPYKLLHTSHAFHSEMMDSILTDFENELHKITLSKPQIPFVSNLSGKRITSQEAESAQYWVKHLRETVNFEKGIKTIVKENKENCFIEIGPGNALSNFCKQNLEFKNNNVITQTLSHPKKEEEDSYTLIKALGVLWTSGIDINWDHYYENEERKKVSIPTYCFENFKFQSRIDVQKLYDKLGRVQNVDNNNCSDWFYSLNWKKSFKKPTVKTETCSDNYLLFTSNSLFINSFKQSLINDGNRVVEVIIGKEFVKEKKDLFKINPNALEDFNKLFSALENEEIFVNQVICNWAWPNTYDKLDYTNVFNHHLNICKSLIRYRSEEKKKLTFISDYQNDIFGDEKININQLAAESIAKISSHEHPLLFSNSIDVAQETTDKFVVDQIIEEVKGNYEDTDIAYRNRHKWVPFYEKTEIKSELQQDFISQEKTYLVTGGLGNVGAILTAHLCDTYNVKVILIGRSMLPSKEQWNTLDHFEDKNKSISRKVNELIEHHKKKRKVEYYSVNISDEKKLRDTIEQIEEAHGNISGIIHAAGTSDHDTFKFVEEIDDETVKRHFDPKVSGTLNLYNVFKSRSLDFVWITSSLSTALGGLTYGTYVGANKYIDKFVLSKKEELSNWVCVNLDGIGENGISNEQLINIFEQSIKLDHHTQLFISIGDLNEKIEKQKHQLESTVNSIENEQIVVDRPAIQVKYTPPVTTIQKELCAIWESFFGYDSIGVYDDFFELGGDSLKAMTIIKRINKVFKASINLKDFFSKPTIDQLSVEIELIQDLSNLQIEKEGRKTIKI